MTIYVEVTPAPCEVEVGLDDIIEGIKSDEDVALLVDKLLQSSSLTVIGDLAGGLLLEYRRDSFIRQRVDLTLGREGFKLVKV